jgi:hypothetical protein
MAFTRLGAAALFVSIFLSQAVLAGEAVDISAFGIRPDTSDDATPAVRGRRPSRARR